MDDVKTKANKESSAPRPWGVAARAAVSLLLVWHLVAILIGPLSLPPSRLATTLYEDGFRPYVEILDLNHPYKFFAPDPGPCHLIEYDLELADGTHRKGTFPDRNEHWPRLLYHRHFMLTEWIGNVEPRPANVGESNRDPAIPEFVRYDYAKQQAYAKSYAEHLLHASGAKQVTLQLTRHHLAEPDDIRNGLPLDRPESYVRRSLGTFSGGRR